MRLSFRKISCIEEPEEHSSSQLVSFDERDLVFHLAPVSAWIWITAYEWKIWRTARWIPTPRSIAFKHLGLRFRKTRNYKTFWRFWCEFALSSILLAPDARDKIFRGSYRFLLSFLNVPYNRQILFERKKLEHPVKVITVDTPRIVVERDRHWSDTTSSKGEAQCTSYRLQPISYMYV